MGSEMKRLKPYIFIIVIFAVCILSTFETAHAHSGGTDSQGGHKCWTNCGAHGLEHGEYHFHNTPSTPSSQITDTRTEQDKGGYDEENRSSTDDNSNIGQVYLAILFLTFVVMPAMSYLSTRFKQAKKNQGTKSVQHGNAPQASQSHSSPTQQTQEASRNSSDLRNCPRCEVGQLTKRKGRYGPFIGCSSYPSCTYTEKHMNGKRCNKCKQLKSKKDFYDSSLKSNFGINCRKCKGLE